MPLAIITGGTRGIGRSMVNKFAIMGFDIATCSRNIKELEYLKLQILELNPNIKVFIQPCDVSIKEEIQAFGENILKEMVMPSILINNTGIFLPGQIHSEEDGVFENQWMTNLASAYHLTRKILPGMISANKGYIFNMCSIASIAAYSNGGSYTISKFGLLGFSKVLREELKEYNIRVTSVLPGATLTSSWEGTELPKNRFINPDDVADLVYSMAVSPETMVVEEILIRPLKGDIE